MAAGSIVIDLLMKTGSFETDTARAAKSLKKLQKEAEDIGRKIGLALTAATAGLFYLTKSAIDSQDALNDLSQKTGIAADTLGGFGFAAQQAGGDLQSAAAGLGKLNKTIAEAAAGNKDAAEFFKVLGINVKDSSGKIKDAGTIYLEVADKFATFEDGPNKAALALRAFGKAGLDQIPLLNQGGTALRAQIDYYKQYSGVTNESVKRADEFNDTLTKIKLLSGAFGQTLATELLPSLQALAGLWLENKEKGDQFKGTAGDIAEFLRAVAVTGAFTAGIFVALGKAMGGVLAVAINLAQFNVSAALSIGKETLNDIGEAQKRFEAIRAAINSTQSQNVTLGINHGSGPRGAPASVKPPAPGLAGPKEAGPKQSEADRYIESLQKQLEKTQELTTVEQILLDIQNKRITGLGPRQQAEALALGARIDAAKIEKQLSDDKAKAQEELFQQNKRAVEAGFQEATELQKQNDAFREHNEEIGLSVEAEYALQKARIASLITIKEGTLATLDAAGGNDLLTASLRDQIAALKERLGLVDDKRARESASDAAKKLADEAKALNESIRGSFEDSFVGFITGAQTAGQAFRGFANTVIQELLRIEARKLALSIFGDGTSQGSGFASLISALAALGGSSDFTGVGQAAGRPRGGAATGTNFVERDMVTMLHKGEAVIPKAYNPAAGGRGIPVIKIENAPAGYSADARQESDGTVVLALREMVRSEIGKATRPGGSIRQGLRAQPPDRS